MKKSNTCLMSSLRYIGFVVLIILVNSCSKESNGGGGNSSTDNYFDSVCNSLNSPDCDLLKGDWYELNSIYNPFELSVRTFWRFRADFKLVSPIIPNGSYILDPTCSKLSLYDQYGKLKIVSTVLAVNDSFAIIRVPGPYQEDILLCRGSFYSDPIALHSPLNRALTAIMANNCNDSEYELQQSSYYIGDLHGCPCHELYSGLDCDVIHHRISVDQDDIFYGATSSPNNDIILVISNHLIVVDPISLNIKSDAIISPEFPDWVNNLGNSMCWDGDDLYFLHRGASSSGSMSRVYRYNSISGAINLIHETKEYAIELAFVGNKLMVITQDYVNPSKSIYQIDKTNGNKLGSAIKIAASNRALLSDLFIFINYGNTIDALDSNFNLKKSISGVAKMLYVNGSEVFYRVGIQAGQFCISYDMLTSNTDTLFDELAFIPSFTDKLYSYDYSLFEIGSSLYFKGRNSVGLINTSTKRPRWVFEFNQYFNQELLSGPLVKVGGDIFDIRRSSIYPGYDIFITKVDSRMTNQIYPSCN